MVPTMSWSRRRCVRQALAPGERLPVTLACPGRTAPAAGELLDLSLGGLAVLLRGDAPTPATGQAMRARLPFPGLDPEDTYPCAIANIAVVPGGVRAGLRFLGGDAAGSERRRRALAGFLFALHRARLAEWAGRLPAPR
jgi:hypothetical protein